MSHTEQRKRRIPITDAIEKRVALVNGDFDLTPVTLEAMRDIREAAGAYARELDAIFHREGVTFDVGRVIATMDHVQQTKLLACDAVALPHASKEETVNVIAAKENK